MTSECEETAVAVGKAAELRKRRFLDADASREMPIKPRDCSLLGVCSQSFSTVNQLSRQLFEVGQEISADHRR